MQEIIIDFEVTGESHLEGKGFPGKTCDKEMGHFEKALGAVSSRKNKPSYYQAVSGNAKQRV
jgi:hypothetical protein